MSSSGASKEGSRINAQIKAPQVQLINEAGENIGVVQLDEALQRAKDADLDLVEVMPKADPPVCKILDYGRYKYQVQKKASEAKKKQKVIALKEIRMRPNIGEHDYEFKMQNLKRFIESGDKVKITIRFRGREASHQEVGYRLFERVKTDSALYAKIESHVRMESRTLMTMILAPVG